MVLLARKEVLGRCSALCFAGPFFRQHHRRLLWTVRHRARADGAARQAIEQGKEAVEQELRAVDWVDPAWMIAGIVLLFPFFGVGLVAALWSGLLGGLWGGAA